MFMLIVLLEPPFSRPDRPLKRLLIHDTLISQGLQNSLVFPALLLLLNRLRSFPRVGAGAGAVLGVAGQRGGATQGLPGGVEADPVAGAAEDFDPVGAGGGAGGEEDGVAVADAGEAGGVVGVAEVFLCGGLEQRVAEEEAVEGVGEERVVGDALVAVGEGGGGGGGGRRGAGWWVRGER
jgi:hypothetical protein